MKRFWLVLLSLGLVMAFSVSAFAVDVKFSGDYSVAGVYLDKVAVDNGWDGSKGTIGANNPSTAFYAQKLRIGTDFIVSPGLKLVTQFDALDRIWGGARGGAFTPGATENNGGIAGGSTRSEAENIVLDQVYVDYVSKIGEFRVGYQKDYVFGTVFGDRGNGATSGQINYIVPVGPVYILAGLAKEVDSSASAVTPSTVTDRDFDSYRLGVVYMTKNIEGGALLLYNRNAEYRASFLVNAYNLVPYFKAKIGPVALQGELNYGFGDAMKFEQPYMAPYNVSVNTLSVFLDATANLGMFNVGGSFAYVSGQDPGDTTKSENGADTGNSGGLDWNPCLIMFNTDLNYWGGNVVGHSQTVVNGEMSNAWFGQIRAGVKAAPALDITASLSYAVADKKSVYYNTGDPTTTGYYPVSNGTYGWEVDVTGTYKITNNLSYMLGAGYLFTGDYFQGLYTGAQTTNDYILVNKLTLTF